MRPPAPAPTSLHCAAECPFLWSHTGGKSANPKKPGGNKRKTPEESSHAEETGNKGAETKGGDAEVDITKVKIGKVVHIPASVFPKDKPPKEGFWTGKVVYTKNGGENDAGIRIADEDIFTRPKLEVAGWLVG